MYSRAANTYRRVDLDSAPKHSVVERLFERFLVDLDAARSAVAARDIATKAKVLDHALRIVNELEASLDHNVAPELCTNLARIYAFVTERIHHANLTLDLSALDDASRVMREIGEGFREAGQPR